MNKADAQQLVIDAITKQTELLAAQGATIQTQNELLLKQSELIAKQEESLKAISKALIYASETTGLMSRKIQELQADHQLVSLIKPVNGWIN
jgi:hypothetical protein